jgi:hypothetical protein
MSFCIFCIDLRLAWSACLPAHILHERNGRRPAQATVMIEFAFHAGSSAFSAFKVQRCGTLPRS